MKRIINQFYSRIKNLIKWFPIIWNDDDWDYTDILKVFKFKLLQHYHYAKTEALHPSSNRDSQRMMLCCNLIDKVQSEWYLTEHFDYCTFTIASTPYNNNGKIMSLQKCVAEENFEAYFSKYPNLYDNIKKQWGKEDEDIAVEMGIINHNRAKHLLFKILEENIEKWWY